MWPDDVVSDTADLFKVLGSTTRIRILRALAVEELCVCELSELLGMTSSAVSHQLRDLRNLKLVRLRSEGKLAFYRVADPSLLALVEVAIGRCSPGAALAGGDRS